VLTDFITASYNPLTILCKTNRSGSIFMAL